MSRDWRLSLDDVVEAADLVTVLTLGMSREMFVADRQTYHAVRRNLTSWHTAISIRWTR